MGYRGRVKNGRVVLDGGAALPEGCQVRLEVLATPVSPKADQAASDAHGPARADKLVKYSGIVKDLPADAARNLDHYLYGHPRQ